MSKKKLKPNTNVKKIKRLGKVVVQKLHTGKTVLNVPQPMKHDGLERLYHSKRFVATEANKDVTLVKQGNMNVIKPMIFGNIAQYRKGWVLDGGFYKPCLKVTPMSVKVMETGQVIACEHETIFLVEDTVTYSLTIKQSPDEQANQMATKKAAKKSSKKASSKKAVKKEAKRSKDGGKIANIIALHKTGLSNQEIVAKGFNKTTVGIQVAKYKRGESNYK